MSRCPSLEPNTACSRLMVPILVPPGFVAAGAVAALGAEGNAAPGLPVWATAVTAKAKAVAKKNRTSLLVMGLLWTPWKFVPGNCSDCFHRQMLGRAPRSTRPFDLTGEGGPDVPTAHAEPEGVLTTPYAVIFQGMNTDIIGTPSPHVKPRPPFGSRTSDPRTSDLGLFAPRALGVIATRHLSPRCAC